MPLQGEVVAAEYSHHKLSFASDDARAKVAGLDRPPKLYIADGLYGLGKHEWDSPDKKWTKANYKQVIELAQACPTKTSTQPN